MYSTSSPHGLFGTTDAIHENSTHTECQSRRTPTFLVFSVLPTLSIVINGFILLAIVLYRHKLRQNHVYCLVGNTLLTNMIFSLLALYQILNLYFALDGYPDTEAVEKQGVVRNDARLWWAFYRAMLTAMFLVMCGNIGVLVSAIRDTSHGPLLFGSRALELFNKNRMDHGRKLAKMLSGFDRKRRQRRTWFYIFFVWLLPLLYVISAPLGWSCGWSCICLSGCYQHSQLDTLSHRHCSRVWPPMRHDWLFVGVTAWVICVFVVVAISWRAFTATKRHFQFCQDRVVNGNTSVVNQNICDDIPPVSYVKSPRHRSLMRSRQVSGRTLSSLRYLIWITVLFVVCTSPAMVLMLYDFFSDTNPSMALGNGCLCVSFAYCWICPLLLTRCLPGIRSAISSLLLKICKGGVKTQQRSIVSQVQSTSENV
ncbi:uncharacterized protein LOC143454626 [Clavelina lepadiformis]|uniref:uncharacterized protein LOC143454626 n=1 Tax=Clavelina lepadiformis TaxID=159417 RepID=UPI0040429188